MFLYVELDKSLKFLDYSKPFKFKLHASDHQQVTYSLKTFLVGRMIIEVPPIRTVPLSVSLFCSSHFWYAEYSIK